jgi:hypothetical protein
LVIRVSRDPAENTSTLLLCLVAAGAEVGGADVFADELPHPVAIKATLANPASATVTFLRDAS